MGTCPRGSRMLQVVTSLNTGLKFHLSWHEHSRFPLDARHSPVHGLWLCSPSSPCHCFCTSTLLCLKASHRVSLTPLRFALEALQQATAQRAEAMSQRLAAALMQVPGSPVPLEEQVRDYARAGMTGCRNRGFMPPGMTVHCQRVCSGSCSGQGFGI